MLPLLPSSNIAEWTRSKVHDVDVEDDDDDDNDDDDDDDDVDVSFCTLSMIIANNDKEKIYSPMETLVEWPNGDQIKCDQLINQSTKMRQPAKNTCRTSAERKT